MTVAASDEEQITDGRPDARVGDLRRPEGRRPPLADRRDVPAVVLDVHLRPGCQGVLTGPAPELVQGCCSYGAHFSDKKDRDHVVQVAKKLRDDEWQFATSAGRRASTPRRARTTTGSSEWRTRLVEDACIFLNRPGFAGGAGCALHVHAMRTGAAPQRREARGVLAAPAAADRRGAGGRERRSRRSPSSAATAGVRAARTSTGGAPRRPRRSSVASPCTGSSASSCARCSATSSTSRSSRTSTSDAARGSTPVRHPAERAGPSFGRRRR